MYARKKANKSGIISVQVIDKSRGSYRVIKTIGSSADLSVLDELVSEAEQWIITSQGLQDMFSIAAQNLDERQSNES